MNETEGKNQRQTHRVTERERERERILLTKLEKNLADFPNEPSECVVILVFTTLTCLSDFRRFSRALFPFDPYFKVSLHLRNSKLHPVCLFWKLTLAR